MSKNEYQILDSDICIKSLMDKLDPDKPFYRDLHKADILVLPHKSFKDYNSPVFSEETESFVIYAKNTLQNEDTNIELYMQDDNYEELELHADTLNIPMLIWDYIVHPIAIGLVLNYVTGLIKQRNKKVDIKIDTIIEKDKKAKMISFSGSIEYWQQFMGKLPENFWNDEIK